MKECKSKLYPWFIPLWQRLEKAWCDGRFAHAYTIMGGEGDGLFEFGQTLMQVLCCQKKNGFSACSQCPGCKQAQSNQHPDVQILAGEGHSIKIEQIRELAAWLQTTRHYHTPRVILIYPACSLTESAANALLKILEEPPPETHFFLLSTQTKPLLATIRSRCQILRPAKLSFSEATTWLQEQTQQKIDYCEQALQLFGSQLLAAKVWLESEDAILFAERFLALEEILRTHEYPDVLITSWCKSDCDHHLFLTAWQQWCGRCIADLLRGKAVPILNHASPARGLGWLWHIWDRLQQAREHLQLGVVLQPRLLYESLIYAWVHPKEC